MSYIKIFCPLVKTCVQLFRYLGILFHVFLPCLECSRKCYFQSSLPYLPVQAFQLWAWHRKIRGSMWSSAQGSSYFSPSTCSFIHKECRTYGWLTVVKAAGSSLMNKLTNSLLLDALRIAGISRVKDCFLGDYLLALPVPYLPVVYFFVIVVSLLGSGSLVMSIDPLQVRYS